MKLSSIVFGLCLASGLVLAPATASAQTPLSLECKGQQIVLPTKNVTVAFENKGMCNDHAAATRKSAEGKTLSASDAERAKLMIWLDVNLEAGDSLNIDRFGRATLMRCSTDPNAQMMPKPAPVIGDGAYKLYILLELPPTALACAKAS